MREQDKIDQIYSLIIMGMMIVGIILLIRFIQGYIASAQVYFVWIVMLISFLIASRLSKKIKQNILLILLSTLLTLYLVEFMLYAFGNPFDGLMGRPMAAMRHGVTFDKRQPLDVVDELAAEGIEAVPYLSPSANFADNPQSFNNDLFHPVSGIANAQTVYCNEAGDYVVYQSDQYGFNNPSDVWSDPPLQIAIMGDSFAQGACVQPESSLAGLLREQYPRTATLGMNGNGPFSMLASLKEYIGPHNPDVIIWMWFEENDMGDLDREKRSPILPYYLESSYTQNLLNRQQDVDMVMQAYIDDVKKVIAKDERDQAALRPQLFWSSLRLFQIRHLLGLTLESETIEEEYIDTLQKIRRRSRVTPQLDANVNENFTLFQRILLDSYWYSEAWQPALYFVYVPTYHRFGGDMVTSPEAFSRQFVLTAVQESNWQLVDLQPIIAEQEDPLSLYPFGIDGHFNEKGYALIADTLLNIIKEKQEVD